MTVHGLSFDLEDWNQLAELRLDGEASDPSPEIESCVDRMLDLCDEADVKATFFALGLLARSRPGIIKRIAQRGHEIASHSVRHRLVHRMSAGEFLADVRESKALLEDLSGTEVVGFRAPEFSVQRLDHPCFAALCEAGFLYDSSVFPVGMLRYGIAGAPTTRFSIATDAGPLVELPLATTPVGGRRFPIAGGSHFRVLPTTFVAWAAARADDRGESLVFYFHPYEFSTAWLRLPGGFARNRPIARHVLLHNFATWRVQYTLRRLLTRLDFVPLREIAKGA